MTNEEQIERWLTTDRPAWSPTVIVGRKLASIIGSVQSPESDKIASLLPADLDAAPTFHYKRYLAIGLMTPGGSWLELRREGFTWLVMTSDGRYTPACVSMLGAVRVAHAMFGFAGYSVEDCITLTTAVRMFAMHETEANWPRGWRFDPERE